MRIFCIAKDSHIFPTAKDSHIFPTKNNSVFDNVVSINLMSVVRLTMLLTTGPRMSGKSSIVYQIGQNIYQIWQYVYQWIAAELLIVHFFTFCTVMIRDY